MTSQESNTTIGNMNMSRIFNVTATDGQYNNADDTITSTSIGLSIPNQTITFVASTYAAGCSVWAHNLKHYQHHQEAGALHLKPLIQLKPSAPSHPM